MVEMGLRLRVSSLVPFALVACSTFSESDRPPASDVRDGGSADAADEAAPLRDAGDDGGLPCRDAACGEAIATGQAKASEVIVDDARVYWTIDDTQGTIMARARSGGAPYELLVDDGMRPRSVAFSGELLTFVAGSDARYMLHTANGNGSALIATVSGAQLTSGVRVGNNVFVTTGEQVRWCNIAAGNACPNFSLSNTHGVGPGARSVVVDGAGSKVWLATDAAIWSSDPVNPNWIELWKLGGVRAIAADDAFVFVASSMNGVARWNKGDGKDAAPTIIASDLPPAYAVAVNGTHVFYTAFEAGLVVKAARDGSSATIHASALPFPKGIAVTLDRVFVVLSDGRIVSLPT